MAARSCIHSGIPQGSSYFPAQGFTRSSHLTSEHPTVDCRPMWVFERLNPKTEGSPRLCHVARYMFCYLSNLYWIVVDLQCRVHFQSMAMWFIYAFLVVQSLSHIPLFFVAMDCRLLGYSVRGFSHGTILEWVAISSSRVSLWPRDQTHISCIGKQILYHWATREALSYTSV